MIRTRPSGDTFIKLAEGIPQLVDQFANLQFSICRLRRAAAHEQLDLVIHCVSRLDQFLEMRRAVVIHPIRFRKAPSLGFSTCGRDGRVQMILDYMLNTNERPVR